MDAVRHFGISYTFGGLMRWYAIPMVFTFVLVWLTLSAPELTLLAMGPVAAVTLFFLRPKLSAGTTIVVILFGSALTVTTGVESLGYLDEVLIALALVIFTAHRILSRRMPRAIPGGGWFMLYLIFGAMSSLSKDVPLMLAGQSAYLMIKGVIFAFAVAQIDWKTGDIQKAIKPAAWIISLVLIASVGNWLAPSAWEAFFGRRASGVDYRLGLPSLIGPFSHPLVYGQFMALAAVAIIAYRANVRKSSGSAILLMGTAVGGILSFRRKAIVAGIAASVVARWVTPGKRTGTAFGAILILPIAVMVGWDSISTIINFTYNEYLANPERTARTLLYRDSVVLATAAFPLGVGFARFGSFTASQTYSPEYVELGYPSIYRMGVGDNSGFLSDTFWPAIVGETGFIGLAAFALGLLALARQGKTLIRTNPDDPYLKWIGVVCIAWFVEFFIESLASPVFSSPPLYVLCFGVAGVVASLLAQQTESNKATRSYLRGVATYKPRLTRR